MPSRETQPRAEVVAQPHRARRVVAHRRDPAVGGAGAERHDRGGPRGQPVDPRAGRDRLAGRPVDAERGPVAVAVDLLVGDRALEHEHERVEPAARRVVPRLHEVLAGLVGEHRVVDDDPGHPRDARPSAGPRATGWWPPSSRPCRRRSPARWSSRRRGRRGARSCLPGRELGAHGQPRRQAWTARGAPRRRGARRASRSTRHARCCSTRAVQVPFVGAAGDEPGLGQASQRVRHRRALGSDELAEQAMGERQRDADAARLDLPPARGEVPEQQRQAHLQPRLAGDRALDVEVARRACRPGAAGRAGSAATGGCARRSRRRARRRGRARARASRRCARAARRRPGPTAAAGRPGP